MFDRKKTVNGFNIIKRICFAVLFMLFILCFVPRVSARYAQLIDDEAKLTSSKFYVSSDFLGNSGTAYSVNNWNGNALDIFLYNYEYPNRQLLSEDDILYTITVSGGTLSGIYEDNNIVRAESGRYCILCDTPKAQRLHIIPNGEGIVSVAVTTVSPYSKTLQATFDVRST